MKLIVVNSSSSGNSYALDAGGEILLLEAGCKMAEVKKHIDYRLQDVVGCVVSHAHGDHARYAVEYAKFGVKVYCNRDVEKKKSFPYGMCQTMESGSTYFIGKFGVVPFNLHHDVPSFGYFIHHKDMGTFIFVTDTFKIDFGVKDVDHWLIEANYSDPILKENVWNGTVSKPQADRIMISHMSLQYTVKHLRECCAEKSKTITLCHLSERNSDPELFQKTVAGAFGVPTFIARKGLVVELNKDVI